MDSTLAGKEELDRISSFEVFSGSKPVYTWDIDKLPIHVGFYCDPFVAKHLDMLLKDMMHTPTYYKYTAEVGKRDTYLIIITLVKSDNRVGTNPLRDLAQLINHIDKHILASNYSVTASFSAIYTTEAVQLDTL